MTIAELREQAGLTRRELCAEIGLSLTTLQVVERTTRFGSDRSIRRETAELIAAFFGRSVEDINWLGLNIDSPVGALPGVKNDAAHGQVHARRTCGIHFQQVPTTGVCDYCD